MVCTWIAEIASDQARALGRLRSLPGGELAEAEGRYWIRGASTMEEAQLALRTIPHTTLYHVETRGLRPWGHQLVARPMPRLTFAPLHKGVRPKLPIASYPTAQVSQVSVTLVRSEEEQPSIYLETSLKMWATYAETAPKVRLDRWSFAVTNTGRVLVRGQPLPPLVGKRYWESDGVAIPIGWTCTLGIKGIALSQFVGRAEEEVVLFDEQGRVESISGESFVQASRSAIRATARASNDYEP